MRSPRVAEHVLIALGLTAVLLTFRDYGVTWDEWLQSRYGELVLAYFRSGLRDERHATLLDLRFYGPLFETLCALAYAAVPGWKAEVRHLLSACAGLLSVLGVMRYARPLGRPWLPLLAGLSLLIWPRFYGHSFINSKDIPFACATVWAMHLIARFHLGGRRRRDALLAGLLLGVALAIRPGGIVLFAFLVAAAALDLVRRGCVRAPGEVARAFAAAAGIAAVAWAVMVLCWPWAHGGPIERPLLALSLAARFPATIPVLFEGALYAPSALPRHYVPEYLLITPPLTYLLFGSIGILAALRGELGKREPAASERLFLTRLTLLWLSLPIVAVVLLRPPLYDEIRHFLFVLPAAAVLVALGALTAFEALRPQLGRLALLLPLLLLEPLPALVRLHPYQYVYFNALVGGVGGAARAFETDYWLSSYKEAMEWINAQPRIPGRKRRLAITANLSSRYCAEYYAGPDLEVKTVAEAEADPSWRYDTFLSMNRLGLPESATAPVVHVVGRDGALFAIVKQR